MKKKKAKNRFMKARVIVTYNQKTLTSKDKKFFTSVIKSYFGD